MSDYVNTVIIGGGIAGCSTAYFLGKSGVPSLILENEGIASGASGYSAGGLNPLVGHGIPGLHRLGEARMPMMAGHGIPGLHRLGEARITRPGGSER